MCQYSTGISAERVHPGVQEGQGGNGKSFLLCRAVQCAQDKQIQTGNLSLGADRFVMQSKMRLYELFLYIHNGQQHRGHEHSKIDMGKKSQDLIISSLMTCILLQIVGKWG